MLCPSFHVEKMNDFLLVPLQWFSAYQSLTQSHHCSMPYCPGDCGALGPDSPEILLPLHAQVPGMSELGIFLLYK